LLGEFAGVGMSLDAWFRSERREFGLLEIDIKVIFWAYSHKKNLRHTDFTMIQH
jgi:hypothetical protein